MLIFIFTGKSAHLYKKDDPDWVPSLNMQVKTSCKKGKQVDQGTDAIEYTSPEAERYSRRQRRTKIKLDYSAADTLLLLSQVNPLAESVDTDDDKCLSIYLCISSVYSQVPFNIS